MTNYEWLLNMSGEERQAWFDAEHVENQNGTLDGARAALDAKFAELTAKCYELQAQVDVLTYERDYYIGLCHRAVEAGEKFATLVDMNGEVLS